MKFGNFEYRIEIGEDEVYCIKDGALFDKKLIKSIKIKTKET
jgi:hypothetical protein